MEEVPMDVILLIDEPKVVVMSDNDSTKMKVDSLKTELYKRDKSTSGKKLSYKKSL